MPEKFEQLNQQNQELERSHEIKSSEEICSEALPALEKSLKNEIDRRAPRLAEEQQKMEPISDEKGSQIGFIERIRRPETSKTGKQDLWLVVDFDDVINKTTTFNNELFKRLSEQSGIAEKKLNEFYESAKLPSQKGEKVFKFSEFIGRIKEEGSNAEALEGVVKGLDYNKFVDQAVKRALMAARLDGFEKFVRVSILTHGDPEYQKMRIDGTDLKDVVDDIIYTEGSKSQVVANLLEEYDDKPPFIITLDDNPKHVDDYENLPMPRRYANMRFHNPQAKRFGKKHDAKKAIIDEESSPNQAAVNIYKASCIATHPYAQQDREKLLQIFGNPEAYDDILNHWGGYRRHENIVWLQEGSHIIREYDDYAFKDEWSPRQHIQQDLGEILPDGSFSRRFTGYNDVGFEEFIKKAQ